MEGILLHTIPLFKLFPGRPKSTFFSSSFFLGGILLLYLAVEAEKVRLPIVEDWKSGVDRGAALSWKRNADPAAEIWNSQETEVKKYGRRRKAVVLRIF